MNRHKSCAYWYLGAYLALGTGSGLFPGLGPENQLLDVVLELLQQECHDRAVLALPGAHGQEVVLVRQLGGFIGDLQHLYNLKRPAEMTRRKGTGAGMFLLVTRRA